MAELRKVCAHPAVLPEYASASEDADAVAAAATVTASQAGAGAAVKAEDGLQPAYRAGGAGPEAASGLVDSSGKLRLLQQLLPALRAAGHKILLLSHSRKVMRAPASGCSRGLSTHLLQCAKHCISWHTHQRIRDSLTQKPVL